ncbi:hypothetical protein JOB18_041558 [Solea senegalensis]|uniref:Uncharacterized protein n=1 Tax=Solea senegalensis TaxID=28829 RepID=A0AAV6SB32_SOLSE|nr:hypothetical protein JOB18_041558 [Solea senegalensis]
MYILLGTYSCVKHQTSSSSSSSSSNKFGSGKFFAGICSLCSVVFPRKRDFVAQLKGTAAFQKTQTFREEKRCLNLQSTPSQSVKIWNHVEPRER